MQKHLLQLFVLRFVIECFGFGIMLIGLVFSNGVPMSETMNETGHQETQYQEWIQSLSVDDLDEEMSRWLTDDFPEWKNNLLFKEYSRRGILSPA